MLRIVITGAESTGKTTLAKSLSGYYGAPWTGEYVRDYVDEIGRELAASDLDPIARGQLAQEDAGLLKAQRLVFHDTNILSSIIYANHYFETVIDWVNDAFLERDYTLYLFCLPDIPWAADEGQRDSAEARNTLHAKFKDALNKLNLPYLEISGSQVERMHRAVKAIDQVVDASK